MSTALKKTVATFARGIHPPQGKALSQDAPIEVVPTPKQVQIPLLQHAGAVCAMAVKNRQEVVLGDVVGQADAWISAPVHASIAGKVAKDTVATLPNGRHVATIPIRAGKEQMEGMDLRAAILGGSWPTAGLEQYAPDDIVAAVRQAGLVGMGGAAFPTHVKLQPAPKLPIETLLVNGCECEPYLNADYRLMVEAPEAVVSGALLAGRAAAAEKIVVAIEDNKPEAIAALRRAAAGTGIDVAVVETKYPMGGERQLIPAVVGRLVPTGGLPLDVGVVVINVATAVAGAVLRGRALTHRVVTVSGAGVAQPKNLLAPVGISYGELIEFCGGLLPCAARVVSGGPMMGFAVGDLGTPITKGTSGVTVLSHAEIDRGREAACVRCGLCVDVCPLNLVPTKIAHAARAGQWDTARRYHAPVCMECGCCAYICPAQIPLVQLIRAAKASLAGVNGAGISGTGVSEATKGARR
ncbi:MAG: electron transport complex subunit RsxC [Candidatus Latescibacteria bacterium]|nr:electron transport complex subunit RsxC [Candidatus Latescibacterota bacterium]